MEDVSTEQNQGLQQTQEDAKETGYMLVDHEEVLIGQLTTIHDELDKKISGIRKELELHWEILSRLLLLLAPLAITWAASMFARVIGNTTWEVYAAALSCGVIMSVLVFDLHSLLEAIDQLTRVRQENTHPPAADDTDGSEVKTTGGQDKETNTDNMGIQQDDIPREALPDPD